MPLLTVLFFPFMDEFGSRFIASQRVSCDVFQLFFKKTHLKIEKNIRHQLGTFLLHSWDKVASSGLFIICFPHLYLPIKILIKVKKIEE